MQHKTHGLSRRTLLRGSALTFAGLAAAPAALAARPRERGERALVVIELEGGNDGLNTVIPLEDDRYFRARPTLSSVTVGAERIGPGTALHPALGETARLVRDGRCAVLRGVGYPNPDRSHFRSMDVWQTGRVPDAGTGELEVDRRTASGWLGRALEQLEAGPLGGVHVGPAPVPLGLARGGRQGATLDEELLGRPADRPAAVATVQRAQSEPQAGDRPELAAVRQSSTLALDLERRLDAASDFEARADWPTTPLARALSAVAALVATGFPARVYTVRLSGFDTHVSQARLHQSLLAELDGAVSAFDAELAHARAADDVLTLAFSEFGRRVAENGSRGTDHGAAGPALLFGKSVAAGLHGPRPDLGDLDDGDVRHAIDLRSIQGAIARDWLGIEGSTRPGSPAPLNGLLAAR